MFCSVNSCKAKCHDFGGFPDLSSEGVVVVVNPTVLDDLELLLERVAG